MLQLSVMSITHMSQSCLAVACKAFGSQDYFSHQLTTVVQDASGAPTHHHDDLSALASSPQQQHSNEHSCEGCRGAAARVAAQASHVVWCTAAGSA